MNDIALLKLLLAEKSIEEIEALRLEVVATRMGELLHTICCTKDHEKECDFYLPEISTEEGDARGRWKKKAEALLSTAGITSAERAGDLLIILPQSVAVVRRSPDLLAFLTVLLPEIPAEAPNRAALSCVASCPSKTAESL